MDAHDAQTVDSFERFATSMRGRMKKAAQVLAASVLNPQELLFRFYGYCSERSLIGLLGPADAFRPRVFARAAWRRVPAVSA